MPESVGVKSERGVLDTQNQATGHPGAAYDELRDRGAPGDQGVSVASPAQATAHSTLVKVPMMKRSAARVSSWLRSSG